MEELCAFNNTMLVVKEVVVAIKESNRVDVEPNLYNSVMCAIISCIMKHKIKKFIVMNTAHR
jgi:hypothetical protein